MADANDIKVKIQFDRLMTSARVFLQRQDLARAGEAVVKALELRPNDLDARELAADLVLASGDLEKAAAHYKALFSKEAPKPSAEDKYARVVLRIAEDKWQKQQLEDMIANPRKFAYKARNPLMAAIASVGPGFGQIYLGDFKRGAILFGATMISWLLFYYLKPNVAIYPPDERINAFFRELGAGAVFFACVAVFTHVYAIIDAVMSAGKKPGTHSLELTIPNEKQNTPGPQ